MDTDLNIIIKDIKGELKYQQSRWNDDEPKRTKVDWISYIANYVGRTQMPELFDPKRYTFRACMIKVAALAISAIASEEKLNIKL